MTDALTSELEKVNGLIGRLEKQMVERTVFETGKPWKKESVPLSPIRESIESLETTARQMEERLND